MQVRIEYWSPIAADWWVGHHGLEMSDPWAYVRKANARNREPQPANKRPRPVMIIRAVIVDTGEIIHGDGGDLL